MRGNQDFEISAPAGVFDTIGSLVNRGLEKQAIRLAVLRGERNEGQLTNQIFFSRHLERGGKRIGNNEPRLAAEWREIRDTVVRPTLAESGGKAPAQSPVQAANMPMFFGIDYGSVDGNQNPDWARAKNEGPISFAIIRANWGSYPDAVFKRDWPKIKEAGLVRGAYLFLRFPHAESERKYGPRPDPVSQANAFIKTVGSLDESDLPPTLDVEFPGGRALTKMTAQQCLADVRAAWKVLADKYGVAPIIYTSARVWREDLNNLAAPDLIESPLWLTPYPIGRLKPAVRDPKLFAGGRYNPPVPPAWGDATNWWIHQYQGDALQFPGFRQVDMNRFNTTIKGANGDRVKWVQRRLGISVSGNFDDATEGALRAFQQKKGLAADGRIDPRTFAFLCWSNPSPGARIIGLELEPEVANFQGELELNLKSEPFQGYTEFDELNSFETGGGGWQDARPRHGQRLPWVGNPCLAGCRADYEKCIKRGTAPQVCSEWLRRCSERCAWRQALGGGNVTGAPRPGRSRVQAPRSPSHKQFYEWEALNLEVDPEAESEWSGRYPRRRPSTITRRRPRVRPRRSPRRRFQRRYSGGSYPAFAPPADRLNIFPANLGTAFSDQTYGDNVAQPDYADTEPPPPEATSAGADDGTASASGDEDTEFFEYEWRDPDVSEIFYEWMDEVSRSSSEYIRWVQQSLNQIMGLRLAVDGISGPLTRSAARSFQTRARITVDGIVGPQTEAALIAAGAQPPPGATPSGGGGAVRPPTQTLAPLTPAEQSELARLTATAQAQFRQLRTIIESYTGIARRDADRGSRALLRQGHFRQTAQLLPEIILLTNISTLPSGWSLAAARPLLVGNVLYNLAFPETINQGGSDRLGGRPDPTCFSASTQILLARRFPATYVRLTIQLATTNRATFAGGASIGPLTFVSTNLYRSLESVLLQTAFDTYFNQVIGASYTPGAELKVHRQVFGPTRPPRFTTYTSPSSMVSAFRTAFVTRGGNTRPWESVNLCTGNPAVSCGNHNVVLTRVTGGRVYFYNPWANEEEKATMFGTARVSVSGNAERPAESSMTQADFEGQLTAVFHN